MKIKEGLNVHSDDFWYDLTDGGSLNPKEICEKEEDALKVIEAIKMIAEFRDSCEEQIDGFYE